jgi:hypothetical protein
VREDPPRQGVSGEGAEAVIELFCLLVGGWLVWDTQRRITKSYDPASTHGLPFRGYCWMLTILGCWMVVDALWALGTK